MMPSNGDEKAASASRISGIELTNKTQSHYSMRNWLGVVQKRPMANQLPISDPDGP
jgi:hypothetical protein